MNYKKILDNSNIWAVILVASIFMTAIINILSRINYGNLLLLFFVLLLNTTIYLYVYNIGKNDIKKIKTFL